MLLLEGLEDRQPVSLLYPASGGCLHSGLKTPSSIFRVSNFRLRLSQAAIALVLSLLLTLILLRTLMITLGPPR